MGKYRILKPANPVFGLIMERLHHLEGVELGSVFVSLALRTDNSNVHQVTYLLKLRLGAHHVRVASEKKIFI